MGLSNPVYIETHCYIWRRQIKHLPHLLSNWAIRNQQLAKLTVLDADQQAAQSKIGSSPNAKGVAVQVEKESERNSGSLTQILLFLFFLLPFITSCC